MNAEWFEALPEQCPPTDAKRCEGCYYRIANGNPVTTEDFFSQRKMQPDKVFKGLGIDECVTRAVSLFSEREEAEKRLKLPKFKKANIALVILESKDGVLKKTFDIAHYSWWRTKDFNVLQAKIV